MANKDKVTMSVSDFNLEKLTTQEFSEHLLASIQVGGNVYVASRRGSGKSEITKQVIKKSGHRELYLNMSVLEKTEMAGYPNILSPNKDRKYVDFLLPDYFQMLIEGNKPVVALLDEVDKADPSLWAPLLEFTQFKSINGRPLPNLKAVVMTGNLIAEGGARPSLPLLDRAEKYLMTPDVDSWLKWSAHEGRIHPSITAYISDNPGDLFGAADPEDRYSDPSPRGWTRASDILHAGEKLGWSYSLLNKKVSGCIGKEAGIKYSNYYEHYQQLLPMIEDIYRGKDVSDRYAVLEPSKKMVACMIVCARLATQLDQVKEGEPMPMSTKYVGKFLQKAEYENILISVRSQITIDRLLKYNLDSMPEWEEFLKKITKMSEGN